MQIDIKDFSSKITIPRPENNSLDMECNSMFQEHEMLNYIQEMAQIAYGKNEALYALLRVIENKSMSILDAYLIVYRKLNKVKRKKKNLGALNKKNKKAKQPMFELVKNETGFINIKDPNLARYKDPSQPYYFKRIE